jgi:MarR family transcriptional regulator, transcriptional regulator for hemolysin
MQVYDFQNSIGFIVNQTAKGFVKALDLELRQKVGVTVGQWKVMVMLVNQDGLTQKEIAQRLGLEGPTLIPIIDKMEKDDLVVRKVDPADRRNNRVYRTEKADALWNKMIKCALRIRQVSVKGIPEQNINITRNVLERMLQNLSIEFNVACTIVDDIVIEHLTANTASGNTTSTATTATTASTKTRKKIWKVVRNGERTV